MFDTSLPLDLQDISISFPTHLVRETLPVAMLLLV